MTRNNDARTAEIVPAGHTVARPGKRRAKAVNPLVIDQAEQSEDEAVSGDEHEDGNNQYEDDGFIVHSVERERKNHCHRLVQLRRLKRGRECFQIDEDERMLMQENLGLVGVGSESSGSDTTEVVSSSKRHRVHRDALGGFIVDHEPMVTATALTAGDTTESTLPSPSPPPLYVSVAPLASSVPAHPSPSPAASRGKLRWTAAEDAQLLREAERHAHAGRRRWSLVAAAIAETGCSSKRPKQCMARFLVLRPKPKGKPMRDLNSLGERYARMVSRRAARAGAISRPLDLIRRAQTALRYEIATKQPYTVGGCCGRSNSYFQMMLGCLNVQHNSSFKRLTRADMLDVLEVAAEVITMDAGGF